MDLSLSVVRCPDAVVPASRRVSGGELTVGRGEDCDWVLADPNRHLSKRHCTIAYRSGRWTLTDLSTNGTFLDRSGDPVGRGTTVALKDGSRLTLGEYEIEVRVEERGAAQPGYGAAQAGPFDDDPFAPPAPAQPAFGHDPFGRDPFALQQAGAPAPDADPFGGITGPDGGGAVLPDDFDPLADFPSASPAAPSQPAWGGGSRPDHTPAASDAFVPPPVTRTAIPDDWDIGLPAAPSAPPPEARPETPVAAPPAPPPAPMPHPTLGQTPVAPPAPAAPTADSGALMAAFLAGAGLPDLVRRNAAPPEEQMRALGAAFRAFVEGLREVLITRAAIKSEFRIEQTIIAARGNNPLKFSPSVEDALAAMLGEARGAFMSAEDAVRDSLDDIKQHEMASVRAMQAGLRAVLARLDPASLREEADAAGGLNVLPAQKRARAFDAFETRYATLVQDLESTTDGVFARAFAKAYEAAGGRG